MTKNEWKFRQWAERIPGSTVMVSIDRLPYSPQHTLTLNITLTFMNGRRHHFALSDKWDLAHIKRSVMIMEVLAMANGKSMWGTHPSFVKMVVELTLDDMSSD